MSTAPLPEWRDDWALFLDVDGTLLEIAATPAAVEVPRRALAVIARLRERLSGALALVSGRTLADLDRLFAPLRMPAAGAHGGERRDALGVIHRSDDSAALSAARRMLSSWSPVRTGTVLLEDKGLALALHFRQAPELEHDARRVALAAAMAAGVQFGVQEGKSVLEIKPIAADKGRAIEAFMREAPFAGRVPVFVGDDLTDEHGFALVNRLGGHSIAVGIERSTQARWHLPNEERVLSWLETHAGSRAS